MDDQTHLSNPQPKSQGDGIPIDFVKLLVNFKSRHNYIKVLEVSRKADHPFRGFRLLLLNGHGNIHSISLLFRTLTDTYFDVFATLPPIISPGPIGILGFGAGFTAKLILELYPEVVLHGWEIDPSVIDVGREYLGLSKIEKQHSDRLFIYIGNALKACVKGGFSSFLDPVTWEKLRKSLREGGRIMVNLGGICVEAEDSRKDGKYFMEESLKAISKAFSDGLYILSFGNRKNDSSIALTGQLSDSDAWKKAMPKPLRCYVDAWTPLSG
ncbi:hypothetical protein Ancab_035823 [Ancistrocladus abbreviatus]